jgi:hypothetical protein
MGYEIVQYEPAAPPQTARDLARALGVPDDVPLAVPDDRRVVIAALDKPGGSLDYEQIVIGINPAAESNLTGRIDDREIVFYLEGDFPAGEVERSVS